MNLIENIDAAKNAFLARVQDTLHDATLSEVDYFWRCGLEPRDAAVCIHSRRQNQKGGRN